MSPDRSQRLRSAIPEPRPGDATSTPVDLVRRPRVNLVRQQPVSLVRRRRTKVDLVRQRRTKVDLRRRVSLVKPGPAKVSLVKRPRVVRRPSPAHLRPSPTRRLPLRVVVAGAGRAARNTRTWSRGPAGRIAVSGLLLLVIVSLATAAGVLAPRALNAGPASDPETSASPSGPPKDPDDPIDDGAPLPGFSQPPGGQPTTDPGEELVAWAAPMSVKTGIPVQALQAYAAAELAVLGDLPGCGLRWTTLAGIGLVESNHGRAGNSTLTNDGRSVPPIRGLPLDGQGGRKAIPDTDGGNLDGDRTWDRAMGAMQFIPDTWSRYAADGDADGVTDPNDINDAALAAARYLCAGGRNLSTVDGWKAAIFAYNNVSTYVQSVYNAANDYGARSRG